MADGATLDGKVVIVTGAGRGIGREIALLAAAEGAKVVVNDLGGAADGSGKSSSPAEEVVELIRQKGGTAVPNFDTVAEPSAAATIVKTALDHFGKLDGVVNNAGILRDAIFHKMSVADFELVIKVHLLGSFYVSHAAARLFRDQGSGAFVHFTSTSGLVGNFGQANYAAAKLGIVGLSKSIALDMALQRAFELRVAFCLEPPYWYHSDQYRRGEGADRAHPDYGPGENRAAQRVSAQRPSQRCDWTDLRRAHERNLLDEPVAPDPFGASLRGLDLPLGRRAWHAGAQNIVLSVGSVGGCFLLGRDLRPEHR
jgi:NAD(P)-dependent dehydrogenase (short-subunit alcohol dehydrogenase family)